MWIFTPACNLFINWDGKRRTACFKKRAKLYQLLARHIAVERKRLGGDFIAAISLETKHFRDTMRKVIGPEVVFVILHIEQDLQYQRVLQREKDPKSQRFQHMTKVFPFFDDVSREEENDVKINVTEEKTTEDIVHEILRNLKPKGQTNSDTPN